MRSQPEGGAEACGDNAVRRFVVKDFGLINEAKKARGSAAANFPLRLG